MIKRGKSINMFLINGDVNGCIKCTLKNWTGIAYKIPRKEIENLKDRDDLNKSGIYFLFGISDDLDKYIAYIGQANMRQNGRGILNRLEEHKRNPEKDYWNEAIVFTTSNNSLGSTELNYLENRFCELAINANRYIIKNGNTPSFGNQTEETESDMEEFIEYAKTVMVVLGHKLLIPLTITDNNNLDNYSKDIPLFLTRKNKKTGQLIEAYCKQTNEGFVVLRGSHIERNDAEYLNESMKKRRKFAKIDENNILQEDILFSSPSYAAVFVLGYNSNGLDVWKTKDGIKLKDLENNI